MPNYIFMNFQNHIIPILYFQHRLYFGVLYPYELYYACVITIFIKKFIKQLMRALNLLLNFLMNINISQLILIH